MSFGNERASEREVLVLKLNAVQVLAMACFGAAMGLWLKRKLSILDRLNIPASICGGLIYALAALVLRDRFLNLEMDLTLRDILMVTFFTTIGASASLRLIRVGGIQVLWFFALATGGAIAQNALGVAVAAGTGLNPLLGLVCGSVALIGGPATALAFGGTFEELGLSGATTVGIAAATFGIVAGGLFGGHIGASLVRKHKLQPSLSSVDARTADEAVYEEKAAADTASPFHDEAESEHSPLFQNAIVVAVAMGIGTLISLMFERLGLILPAYVGAMIAAAALRNLDDRFGSLGISQHHLDSIGNIALQVFIVMALMTLRLWELVHLAGPMMLILVLQVGLMLVLGLISFRLMGRDYDAAVMAAGYYGFGMGTTANAMACMDVIVKKHGPAPRAFIVIPLVGAFLIDFTNALLITVFMNLTRP